MAHIHRHGFELAGDHFDACLAQGIGTRLAPSGGAGVVAPDQADAAVAAFDDVLGHGLADGLVGKTDHSVDRVLRQLPGFHHRNATGDQLFPRFRALQLAGQHDAVGAAGEYRIDQFRFTAVCQV
ncbi:hypothetical protein D3C81_1718330 [compost metagenome]